ncbi:MAG: peptidase T [Herpetosiphonaceae bacterium]|nr:MAG: peptidase T [Herpetosiphonaceae bacterium]
MPRAIAVHGGAGNIPESLRPEHNEGIRLAREAGRRVLLEGGSALDAVIAAVIVLEDLPAFNAGYGAVLNAEGYIELDAGLMDGSTLDIGAVAAVQGIRNPILLCRYVLTGPHILFAKEDAARLAAAAGIEQVDPRSLITPRRLEQWLAGQRSLRVDSGAPSSPLSAQGETHPPADTVGAVALDAAGNLAAATSTGGINGKAPGRIGDSPLPGGGFYADNLVGACSTTGWGESLARTLTARRAIEGLERGLTPAQAARAAIDLLGQRIAGGEGGLILLDRHGRFGAAFNSQRMTHAWWSEVDGEGVVA